MGIPAHLESALLDFQRHTAPAVYLAQSIQEESAVPEQVPVLCQAVHQVHEKAEEALEEAVRWSVHSQRNHDTEAQESHENGHGQELRETPGERAHKSEPDVRRMAAYRVWFLHLLAKFPSLNPEPAEGEGTLLHLSRAAVFSMDDPSQIPNDPMDRRA